MKFVGEFSLIYIYFKILLHEHFQHKMHQITFGGRALPGPAGGPNTALPRPPSWIKGSLLLREWGEMGVEGRDKRGREGDGNG